MNDLPSEIKNAIIGVNAEQKAIAERGLEVVAMLLRKNSAYGSSATNPIRVFSKLDAREGIKIRMDDKLSRIRNGAADDDEDPIFDLAGYCILYLVAVDQEANAKREAREAAGASPEAIRAWKNKRAEEARHG